MTERTEYAHGEFCWVDLNAHEMNTARRFYESLFGWTSQSQDTQGGPPYAMFRLNGARVAGIGEMNDEMKAQGIPPLWNSYVNVDDVMASVEKTEKLGGKVTMPPLQILEAGWMAFIQDPTGGNLAVWQKNQHRGADRVQEPGTFTWNELATRDLAEAREFYGQLFDWEFAENPHAPSEYEIIKVHGEQRGGLLQMTGEWGEMPSQWGVYFQVEQLQPTCEQLQELGGQIVCDPFDIPVGRLAIVQDAQGAKFSLIELRSE